MYYFNNIFYDSHFNINLVIFQYKFNKLDEFF